MPRVVLRAKPPAWKVSALGMLVHIHLIGRTPGLPLPVHSLPSMVCMVSGPSCVAVYNIAGSTRQETHGALITLQAVVVIANGFALAGDWVGVFAKTAENTESETSTSSLQLRPLLAFGSVVGAAAETDRRDSSAAPTTYLLRPSAVTHVLLLIGLLFMGLLRVRPRLSSPNLEGSNVLEGRPIASRPILVPPCTSSPRSLTPSAIILLVPPILLNLILLVPACAEAAVAAGTQRGRAGSLVPVARADGGA